MRLWRFTLLRGLEVALCRPRFVLRYRLPRYSHLFSCSTLQIPLFLSPWYIPVSLRCNSLRYKLHLSSYRYHKDLDHLCLKFHAMPVHRREYCCYYCSLFEIFSTSSLIVSSTIDMSPNRSLRCGIILIQFLPTKRSLFSRSFTTIAHKLLRYMFLSKVFYFNYTYYDYFSISRC